MKRYLLQAALAGVFCACNAYAGQKAIEELVLSPGQKKEFSVPSTAKTKVGYSTALSIEEMQSCKNHGVVLTDKDFEAASPVGTSIAIAPVDGKISFALQNVESFPIKVQVFREE